MSLHAGLKASSQHLDPLRLDLPAYRVQRSSARFALESEVGLCPPKGRTELLISYLNGVIK